MLIALAAIAGLVVLRSLLPAGTPRIRDRAGAGAARSVAALEKVRIGDSDQWILARSADVTSPIVLFVHGGPGTSELTLNRRNTRDLEKHFVVVNWDQRGAGKSYRAITDAGRMNVEQFVQDTRELALYLLQRFHHQRLVLAGHSWGSIIGVLTVARYPELFHCYVGIGQAVHSAENEAESYRWTLEQARSRNDRRAVRALEAMGPPPYPGDWLASVLTQRRLLGRFGGELHGSRIGAFGVVAGSLLFSREYTFLDRINFFRGIIGSMRLLWPELQTANLFERVPELRVPVFLMEGRHDHEAPADIAARYFDRLTAPSKELIWFEHSAHLPNTEERELFNRTLIEKVLPIATK